jgi:6-pyruvoyltetrahydropterin/6-carboxytetrahydropterin synthase
MNPRAPYRLYVTKDTLKFSAAHMTVFPGGKKERMHGHNFQVGMQIDLTRADIESMVDFGRIKAEVARLCAAWNERVLLPGRCPLFRVVSEQGGQLEFELCGKRYVLPDEDAEILPVENVTTEGLAEEFLSRFRQSNPSLFEQKEVLGVEVSVTESPGQGAAFAWIRG